MPFFHCRNAFKDNDNLPDPSYVGAGILLLMILCSFTLMVRELGFIGSGLLVYQGGAIIQPRYFPIFLNLILIYSDYYLYSINQPFEKEKGCRSVWGRKI